MSLLIPERNPTPTIEALHQAFCEKYKLEYLPDRLKEDFKNNAYALAILLAPLVSPFATPKFGTYHKSGVMAETAPNHAWVDCMGGIIDPCRWQFTDEEPSIYEGESVGLDYVYEEVTVLKPDRAIVPPRGVGPSPTPFVSFRWEPRVDIFLREQVFQDARSVSHLNIEELTFLAQLPFNYIFPHFQAIYRAIIASGYGQLIPPTFRRYYYHSIYDTTPQDKFTPVA